MNRLGAAFTRVWITRVAGLAAVIFIGGALAQVPIPVQEQVRVFNSLPPAQQQSLIRELQRQLPPAQRDSIRQHAARAGPGAGRSDAGSRSHRGSGAAGGARQASGAGFSRADPRTAIEAAGFAGHSTSSPSRKIPRANARTQDDTAEARRVSRAPRERQSVSARRHRHAVLTGCAGHGVGRPERRRGDRSRARRDGTEAVRRDSHVPAARARWHGRAETFRLRPVRREEQAEYVLVRERDSGARRLRDRPWRHDQRAAVRQSEQRIFPDSEPRGDGQLPGPRAGERERPDVHADARHDQSARVAADDRRAGQHHARRAALDRRVRARRRGSAGLVHRARARHDHERVGDERRCEADRLVAQHRAASQRCDRRHARSVRPAAARRYARRPAASGRRRHLRAADRPQDNRGWRGAAARHLRGEERGVGRPARSARRRVERERESRGCEARARGSESRYDGARHRSRRRGCAVRGARRRRAARAAESPAARELRAARRQRVPAGALPVARRHAPSRPDRGAGAREAAVGFELRADPPRGGAERQRAGGVCGPAGRVAESRERCERGAAAARHRVRVQHRDGAAADHRADRRRDEGAGRAECARADRARSRSGARRRASTRSSLACASAICCAPVGA